jgi:K+-sensing histidine kinase KdpD
MYVTYYHTCHAANNVLKKPKTLTFLASYCYNLIMFGLHRRNKQSDLQIRFIPTAAKIIVILLVGIIVSVFISVTINNYYIGSFVQRINSFAVGINTAHVQSLENLKLPDDSVPYEAVKTKLDEFKKVYSDTRFVYLMDRKQNGSVVFLADSEPSSSPDYSARGDLYDDATPALKAAFTNKQSFVEGPVRDEYGIWYSAIAPVKGIDGQLVAIIGIDVPATSYIVTVLSIGLLPLLTAMIASTVIFFYDRARRRRIDALRFQIELMSITSHELQAPIRGIRWGQETLLRTRLEENQTKLVRTMLQGTVQLENSVENILQLNNISASGSVAELVNLDLAKLIQDIVTSNVLAARQRNISLTFTPSWPTSMIVKADSSSLRRCFSSIIASEIKNTKNGGELQFSYSQKDSKHMIKIINSSLDLSRDELAYMFDYTHQTTKLAKNMSVGAGMGLFMARTTLEQFDGHIRTGMAENDVDVVVLIDLPVVPNHL